MILLPIAVKAFGRDEVEGVLPAEEYDIALRTNDSASEQQMTIFPEENTKGLRENAISVHHTVGPASCRN
jgi:hypothetical protein